MNRRWIIIILAVIGLFISYLIASSFNATKPQNQFSPAIAGRTNSTQSFPSDPRIKDWKSVEDFEQNLAVFETVFWDPRDTTSLRELIRQPGVIAGKDVLEIGTGSGLLALCCIRAGAKKVVATDVNTAAIANAIYNAEHLELADRLEARLVQLDESSAFSVIKPEEKFELIVSNPPWVNREPQSIDEYALYDANFELMKSLFEGLRDHLKPGGRVLLAYGCVDAIRTLEKLASEHEFGFIIRDTRNLADLPEEFLPGMLVEIQVPGQ